MIKTILQWLMVGTVALASNPDPSNTFKFGDGQPSNKNITFNRNQGGANPAIRWNESGTQLEFTNDGTNYTGIGSGSGSGSGLNLITTNPDFENGVALGWTTTGSQAFLPVTAGSNLLFGKGSATFQAFTGAASFQSSLYTVPVGLQGKPCSVALYYKGGDNNIQLQALDASSNVLASVPFSAQTSTAFLSAPFQCPSSGQVRMRVVSTSASALVAVDRTYLGEQNNLSQISQASFFGAMVKKSSDPNCQVDYGTVNATYVDPTSNPCVFTTTGLITAQAPPILGWTASVPAGTYLFTMSFSQNFSAGGGNPSCRIVDDLGNTVVATYQQANSPGNLIPFQGTSAPVTYTSGGNRTYKVQCRDQGVSNHLEIYGVSDFEPAFTMWRFPSDSQTVFSPSTVDWTYYLGFNNGGAIFTDDVASSSTWVPMMDITNALAVQPLNGSGSALISCSGTTLNTGSGCGSDHPDFGAIINVPKPGQVSVEAQVTHCWAGSGSINYIYKIAEVTNGTQTKVQETAASLATGDLNAGLNTQVCTPVTVRGILNFQSAGLHTVKVIVNGSQSITHASSYWHFNGTSPVTALPGSFGWGGSLIIKPLNQQVPAPVLMNQVDSGSAGVEKLVRVNFGGAGSNASPTGCGTDPCTVYSQSGSDVSVINRASTGQYVIHFQPGVFSDVPTCICSTYVGGNGLCSIDDNVTTTATQVQVRTTQSNTGSNIDTNNGVVCMGPH